ncbi:MAG: metallopeptidase family protein [Syntrophaceae bacterium]|nr:metallopeptidase family protein [Syntrophaceae bacterium]
MDDIFYKTAIRALKSLPEEFSDRLVGVEIIIEDFADQETLSSVGVENPWNLLGLYAGIPMDKQSVFYQSPFPERIYIYSKPVMLAARNHQNLYEVIRDVLLHEIGHHFGFDDESLEEMEGRRR